MKKLTALLLCILLTVCSCAYAEDCEHPNAYVEEGVVNAEYVAIDEYLHHVTGVALETTVCPDCGESSSSEGDLLDTDEYHNYLEGVCFDCGFVCDHSSCNSYEFYSNTGYTAKDDQMHIVGCEVHSETYCTICGLSLDETLVEPDYSYEEAHYFENGFCVYCDMENACAHENTSVSDSLEYGGCVQKDEKEHLIQGALYKSTDCLDCGEQIAYELVDPDYTEAESHCFYDGICYQCGAENTCTHENTSSYESSYPYDYIELDPFFHQCVNEQYRVYYCLDCDEEVSSELIDDHYLTSSAHTFWEGVCMDCDYVDELSEPVRLTGEVVSLMEFLTEFDEVADETLNVRLLHLDAVLTADELAALTEEQPLSEHALVMLSAIGYEDAVRELLSYDSFSVSDQTDALLTSLADRLSSLSEDEAAERAVLLDEFFPIERTDDDGFDMRSFYLELSSPKDDGAYTEVYALLYFEEYSDWYLDMVVAG